MTPPPAAAPSPPRARISSWATAPPQPALPPAAGTPRPAAPTQAPAGQTPTPAAQPNAIQDKKPSAPGEDLRPPTASDLVIFMSPVAAEIHPKEHVQIALTVSGGKGLTSGSIDLRIPPGLHLVSVAPGDFITNEGGSFEQIPGKDGALKIVFRRNPAGVDSGLFATLELEGLTPGNAPVLIQGGQFMAGNNPITGRWSNALVTVQ